MIETSARILAPGPYIAMPVRYARVKSTTDASELREKVCYRLRREHRLIAVPCQDDRRLILVATDEPIANRRFVIDGWDIDVTDAGGAAVLTLGTSEGWRLLPELVERLITDAIERCDLWWTFDSLRLWYEREPFEIQEGIRAFRRYAVSAFPIEGVGIGVSIDPETAFFTEDSVAWFLDPNAPAHLRNRRQRDFEYLTRRQVGQYGTLLYDNGVMQTKCYFKEMPRNKTCGNTKPPRVRGQAYGSLVEYYRQTSPKLKVQGNTPIAMVAFNHLKGAQPVAADRLWLRVMNEALPASLVNVDKIEPERRKPMAEAFWKALGLLSFSQIRDTRGIPVTSFNRGDNGVTVGSGERSNRNGIGGVRSVDGSPVRFGKVCGEPEYGHRNGAGRVGLMEEASLIRKSVQNEGQESESALFPPSAFLPGFWQPEADRVRRIPLPTLHFRNGATLDSPARVTAQDYKQHYRRRLALLKETGAYHFPHLMDRTLVCAYPDGAGLCHAAEAMMDGITKGLATMTGKPFDYRLLPYERLEDAVNQLGEEPSPGTAVFVLNDEAEAYADVAIGLADWKVKRVTQDTLRQKHRRLEQGERGRSSWNAFLQMTMLDVFQEMDGIPFRVERLGAFDAQLVIDVSYDRRYYALSLLVARETKGRTDFRLATDVWRKADMKEAVNGRILHDDILRFVSRLIVPGKDAPLASLLIPRDGKLVGDEREWLDRAVVELRQRGCLTPNARVEIMELHKNTEIHLRLWEVHPDGSVTNVPEDTAVRLDGRTEVLATTGAGTLTQGTAEPLLIVAGEGCGAVADVTDSLAASAQLNWSSPGVAQRLPLPFKRTDEELKSRAEEEIRRSR
jgi:hypothetical protein